ncbi:hypothetical protein SF123566_7362 [Shigella flexneri 1235-66]|nr:hypothetical protein SF123566_7362 [Shigella flexneri 1235-66]
MIKMKKCDGYSVYLWGMVLPDSDAMTVYPTCGLHRPDTTH